MSVHKKPHIPTVIRVPLPAHVQRWNRKYGGQVMVSVEEQMEQAIRLASMNVTTGSGGCFGAIISHVRTNRILCGATNVVVAANQSWAHAEATVVALAQQALGVFMLPADEYRLVTSAQMCVGCWGQSLGWNFAEVVASVRGEDVERLTPFKEGKLPRNWRALLRERGTRYISDVLRKAGLRPLVLYGKAGVPYYDAGAQSS